MVCLKPELRPFDFSSGCVFIPSHYYGSPNAGLYIKVNCLYSGWK